MNNKINALLIVFAACLLRVNGQSYLNESRDTVYPKFYMSVGGYFPEVSTSLRIDSEYGIGTDISLEDDFKMADKISVVRFATFYRIGEKSQLLGSFTNLNRRRQYTFDQSVDFLDTTFYANAKADIGFDVYYYALTWRYSIFEKPNWNAGFSLGLRGAQMVASIDASFNNEHYGRKLSVVAPALLVGLHGSAYLTPRLLGRYSLEYFTLTVSGIDINVIETNMSLSYFVTNSFGIGGGYSTSSYKVREIPFSDSFQGKINFSFGGFTLFAVARF